MAQIRSKQIADFLSTVNFGTLSTSDKTKIANAADTKLYIDAQISSLSGDATASIDSLELALSTEIVDRSNDVMAVQDELNAEVLRAEAAEFDLTMSISTEVARAEAAELVLTNALNAEISATNSDVTRIDANVATEKGRIDAILLASDADKDSFAEIVSLINAVDTTNDDALANVIGNLNAEISATNDDVTSINTRATNLEAGLSAEIVATNADVTSIDTRLGEVSGDLVGSVDSLELALSAEISATNSDFARVEANLSNEIVDMTIYVDGQISDVELALSAEISATNSDFARVEANLSNEIVDMTIYVDGQISDVELALSAEISATNADVTSIDTRLGAVSGDLVSSVDSLELALSAEISATNSDFVRVEAHLSAEIYDARLYTSDEMQRATGVEGELSAEIFTEKGRVDAILLAAAADKDSFAEIVSLINLVDTTNDDAFAAYVLSNNAALSAEISATDADFVMVNASVDSLELALSAEISATDADITSIDTRLGAVSGDLVSSVDSLELALSAEISATNSDFVRVEANLSTEIANMTIYVDEEVASLETAHGDRLTSLEGFIMEDAETFVESFVGSGFMYNVTNQVQDENKFLVSAFVNGHKVEVEGVTGAFVTLVDPGYEIDLDDTVVISYQAV